MTWLDLPQAGGMWDTEVLAEEERGHYLNPIKINIL